MCVHDGVMKSTDTKSCISLTEGSLRWGSVCTMTQQSRRFRCRYLSNSFSHKEVERESWDQSTVALLRILVAFRSLSYDRWQLSPGFSVSCADFTNGTLLPGSLTFQPYFGTDISVWNFFKFGTACDSTMNWSELRDQTAKLPWLKNSQSPRNKTKKIPQNYFTDPNWSQ